jgi:Protein of unknown function (DUF3558)
LTPLARFSIDSIDTNGRVMNSTRVRLTGALAAATFALAGCGTSARETEPPAAAAEAPAAGTGAEPNTEAGADKPAGGYADEGYACTLLTRADMETLFGGPVGEPQPRSVGHSRFCQWATAAGDPWVLLEIGIPSKGASAEYDELRKAYKSAKEAKDISGLGDKSYSFYHRGETHVYVLVQDKLVKVAVQYLKGRTLTPQDDVARLTTLSGQVIGRM